jgi:hypothetical protein
VIPMLQKAAAMAARSGHAERELDPRL